MGGTAVPETIAVLAIHNSAQCRLVRVPLSSIDPADAEMMRRPLEVFCRLLRRDDAPIADLSVRMGYRSLEPIHRHFRRGMGASSAAYRRAARGGEGGD